MISDSINSNLPSTISDSKHLNKTNDLNKKYIKYDIKKGRQIKKLNIENNNNNNKTNIDNNIKYLKDNLQKINTESDIIEKKENIPIINQITSPKVAKKQNNQVQKKNHKNKDTEKYYIKINTYKKEKSNRSNTYNNNTNNRNSGKSTSSFDKRKKYIVPKVISKKKRNIKIIKSVNIEEEKEKEKNKKEIKELLTLKLIENKQIEYLKEYQSYMNEFNNKINKINEKKFRFIQEEGIELDDLLQDINEEDNDNKLNDTIDEICEKENENEEE